MITMQGWSSLGRIAKVEELGRTAQRLRAEAEEWWQIGDRARATQTFYEALRINTLARTIAQEPA